MSEDFDFPPRTSAFGAWTGFETPALWAKPIEREGLCVISARKDKSAALIEALRAPTQLGCLSNENETIIATAPETWLFVRAGAERTLAAELRAQLSALASIADQSGAYARLRIGGPNAKAVLQKGAFIDFGAFAPGAAATTHIAHLGVIIWRNDATETYDLALFRSSARDFIHWLEVSA